MIAALILACLAGTVIACALCAMNRLTDEEERVQHRRRVRAGTCFTEEA